VLPIIKADGPEQPTSTEGNGQQRTSKEGAAFGEQTGHDELLRRGLEPVGSTDGKYQDGTTGIDGVYKNPSPPPDYVIAEYKYNTAGLEKGLADGTNQMDDQWVDSRLIDKVGREEAANIREAIDAGNV